MSQIKKNKTIKEKIDNLDDIIDKSKLFEEQIEQLKKLEGLKGYFPYKDYDDKEFKSKSLKYNLQTCQMKLMKSYLKKYLAIHL